MAAAAEEPPETDSPAQDEGPVTQRKAVMTKCNDGNRPNGPKSKRNDLCTLSGRDLNHFSRLLSCKELQVEIISSFDSP